MPCILYLKQRKLHFVSVPELLNFISPGFIDLLKVFYMFSYILVSPLIFFIEVSVFQNRLCKSFYSIARQSYILGIWWESCKLRRLWWVLCLGPAIIFFCVSLPVISHMIRVSDLKSIWFSTCGICYMFRITFPYYSEIFSNSSTPLKENCLLEIQKESWCGRCSS